MILTKSYTAIILFLILSVHLALSCTSFAQSDPQQEEKSLYERLGGLTAISLVVSDFVDVFIQDQLIMSNPAVKERKTPDAAPYVKYQITTLVCQETGGPCQYTGLDMREAHKGLNVSDAEWNRMVEIFAATLEKHNVPEKETQELFSILGPSKDDIVVTSDR